MAIWPFNLFGRKTAQTDAELEALLCLDTNPTNVTAFANAARLLSEGAATLDIDVVKRGPTPDKVDHPALLLLRGEVNPWTSGYEFIRDLMLSTILSNQGLAWVGRNSEGKPAEIIRYSPHCINVAYAVDGSGEPTYQLNGRVLDPRDIVHVRPPFDQAPARLARGATKTAALMEVHAQRLFEKGAKPGGVIEVPAKVGETAEKRVKAGWRAAHEGPEAAGRTAILYDGVTFKQTQLSSVDAQFLELRRFQTEEIARAFNMSPSMLGDLTKSSYANAEQKAKEFLSYSLEPWLCALESAFNRALLSDDERATLTFRFDRDDLSRVDLATRANAINSLIASEVINPNTGAAWIGQPPHAGGETYGNRNITVKPIPDPTGGRNGE